MIELYRDWEIRDNPVTYGERFCATSPDYDVDCDTDGFYICSGFVLTADSIAELKELIDENILEYQDEPANS